ncbi:MAG: sigma-70 family RNA polymerase sigma factor [Lachnospiraceae bacterium]|nr:sigma-70 family RNA polymerase sigma factor [Lachnospiraceae bacterium]MDD6505233.1 sigma-70 family RNA polymerase sigma factor [Lachnospiraceae bacterium]
MVDLSLYTDEELVEKYHDSDSDKELKNQIMTYLLEKYKPLVLKLSNAFYLIGGDQNDLIQEGMIAMYQAVTKYVAGKNTKFSTFATMCINRDLIDATKRAGADKNRFLNEAVSLTSDADEDEFSMEEKIGKLDATMPEEAFFQQAEKKLFFERLEKKLSRLERQVLELFLDGMSYTEIAKVLDKTPKSIDNAFQRIRQKCTEVKSED